MNNEKFTVRTKPLEGESLWGFIFRLLRLNGIPLLVFMNRIKTSNTHYVQRADLGLLDYIPTSLIDIGQIAELTGCSIDELLDMTFCNVLKTFGVNQDEEHARFMSGIVQNKYRFCPKCLRNRAYHRLLWKLSHIAVCPIHEISLMERCHACQKAIKFKEMVDLDGCPHCGYRLSNTPSQPVEFDLLQQKWIHQAWETMIKTCDLRFDPPGVATRLLYLIGERNSKFDRKLIETCLNKKSILPTLLQHARNSLSQKRVLHLTVLLETLCDQGISIDEFLHVEVPHSFIDSMKQGITRRVDQLSCQSPWCNGNGLPGTLVKTGTTMKKRKSGETLLYYLACTECGCEYAVDDSGQLKERTYFIEAYRLLNSITCSSETGLKQLAQVTGLTVDKLQRCLAYFSTRQGCTGVRLVCSLDMHLVIKFVGAIQSGTTMKEIRRWSCWTSYEHFLIHRFHLEVMRALLGIKRPRHEKRADTAVNREKVREAVGRLLECDQDITLGVVCKLVGVCPETIRNWGCNEFIAEAKQLQWEQKVRSRKELIYQKVEDYLLHNATNTVTSGMVYNLLGTNRTVLWRNAPEITSFIHERLLQHNRSVRDMAE